MEHLPKAEGEGALALKADKVGLGHGSPPRWVALASAGRVLRATRPVRLARTECSAICH